MKHIPNIVGALLGIAFISFGLNFWLKFMPVGGGEPSEYQKLFFGAIVPSGFLAFIKALEILGGVLTALPRTRNLGLLILGPIVIGILATNHYIIGGQALYQPPVIAISVMAAYLLWAGRSKFLKLINN